VLNNLAALYYAEAKYAQAEPLYKRSLAIVERAAGSESPEAAHCLANYAALLRKMSRNSEAEKMEARARKISSSLAQ
jgi:tetratricopeptide (TPR) repeat protein